MGSEIEITTSQEHLDLGIHDHQILSTCEITLHLPGLDVASENQYETFVITSPQVSHIKGGSQLEKEYMDSKALKTFLSLVCSPFAIL